MKLLVISSAPFIEKKEGIYAYSPYVNELEIWSNQVDEITFACPFWKTENDLLVTKIPFEIDGFYPIKEFNFKTISNTFNAIPNIIGAVLIMTAFYFVAKYISQLLTDVLTSSNVDALAGKLNMNVIFGDSFSLSALIGKIIFFFIIKLIIIIRLLCCRIASFNFIRF
jgi:hypothetical protein